MKIIAFNSLLASTPVLAECPIAADLATGIRTIETDGTVSVYSAKSGGVVQQDITYSDGATFRTLLSHGVHVLQLADTENGAMVAGSINTTAYDMPAADMPIPDESSRWSVATIKNSSGDIYSETQTQSWGTEFTLTIGACSYHAIAGKIVYESDGFRSDEVVHFIPDLGISLLHSYKGSESELETYTTVLIEAVQ